MIRIAAGLVGTVIPRRYVRGIVRSFDMDTQTLLWVAAAIVGVVYLLKRRSRLRSED